jgi:hypothetical protein
MVARLEKAYLNRFDSQANFKILRSVFLYE